MSPTGTEKMEKPAAKYDVLVEGAAGWISAGLYDSRDEALSYARNWLGDRRGRIRVIEEVFDEDRDRLVQRTIYDRDAADEEMAPAPGTGGAGSDYFWSRATEITLLIVGGLFLLGVGGLIYYYVH